MSWCEALRSPLWLSVKYLSKANGLISLQRYLGDYYFCCVAALAQVSILHLCFVNNTFLYYWIFVLLLCLFLPPELIIWLFANLMKQDLQLILLAHSLVSHPPHEHLLNALRCKWNIMTQVDNVFMDLCSLPCRECSLCPFFYFESKKH